MNRRYTVATLLLLITLSAIGLAVFRRGLVAAEGRSGADFGWLVVFGAAMGLLLALGMTALNGGRAARILTGLFFAPFLGAAVMAQFSLGAGWPLTWALAMLSLGLLFVPAWKGRRRSAVALADGRRV
jgi:hypothetical protein